jgi:hypothetical protein
MSLCLFYLVPDYGWIHNTGAQLQIALEASLQRPWMIAADSLAAAKRLGCNGSMSANLKFLKLM